MENMHPADQAANEYIELQRRHYHKSKPFEAVFVAFFLVFIFGMLALHVALPDKDYSKRENKTLASFPSFSLSALLNREDDKGAEESFIGGYLEDQFPFRDQFMAVDALRQSLLFLGKSNGVFLLSDGTLLPEEPILKEGEPLNYTLLMNTVKVYEQSGAHSGKYETVIALAGKKSAFLEGKLPFDYPVSLMKDNSSRTESILKASGKTFLSLKEAMMPYGEQAIYYKTDHHWTSLGAYYATAAILKEYGKTPAPLSDYTVQTATDDFRGTAYNSAGLYLLEGEELEYFRYEGDEEFTVTLCNALGKELSRRTGFYDLEALKEEHPGTAYDSFVAGVDTPVVRITKEGEERPTLLIIKDSFAHSALPFLAREFDLITVDVRPKNFTLPTLLEKGEIDGVLVLMNEETLW